VATIVTIFLKSTEQISCNLNSKGKSGRKFFHHLDVLGPALTW